VHRSKAGIIDFWLGKSVHHSVESMELYAERDGQAEGLKIYCAHDFLSRIGRLIFNVMRYIICK